MSSLILTSKYPANFAVPNSCSESNYVPETDLEALTIKIVQLGVELRRGRLVKEILLHLRGALQIVHPMALEHILKEFTGAAEEKMNASEAKLLAQDLAALDLDEEFVSSGAAVSNATASASANNNTNASTPSLRFYWEVLRLVLDIARNNSRLESVYHETALKAFGFCRRFSRKSEFRRLSEMIRYHLALSVKYPGQANAVPLTTSTESHQLALELRFNQLTLACDMELWQEAFRTVEDIYGLQLLARKSVRQLTAPEYFDKLARIFAKSDNFLFLAATLLRQPKLDAEQEEILCMATLAAPLEPCDAMGQGQSERLAQIIGLSTVPTRGYLLKLIEQRGILNRAPEHVKSLIKSFATVSVSMGVDSLVGMDGKSPFVRACYENLLSLKIDEIMRRFDSISLKELSEIACLEKVRGSFLPKFNLEMFLLRRKVKGIKINHMTGIVSIDRSVLLANPLPFEGVDASMTWSYLQSEMRKLLNVSESEIIKFQGNLVELLKKEHESNLERRNLIEKRKEQLEAAAAEKERQDARDRALKAQQEAETERLRQMEEIARRDQERLEKERAEIRRIEAEKRLAEQEKMKEAAGARLNREKIAAAATRLDYLERALRAEEIPLLEADYSKQKESDRAAYDSRCKLISDLAKVKFARDLEMKQKFIQSNQFESDYRAFFASASERRQKEFEARQIEAAAALESEKEKRKARVLADIENRRRIEAEREAARAPIVSEPVSSSNKYVPPSKQAGATSWRREAVQEEPAKVEPEPVKSESADNAEQPKKFVPRHKRQN